MNKSALHNSDYITDNAALGLAAVQRTSSTLARSRLLLPIIGILSVLILLAASTLVSYLWPQLSQSLLVLQLLLLLAGLFLIAFTVNRLREQLLEPLDSMKEWSEWIRAGRLDSHIPLPAKGEFANLIQDVNGITEELNVLTEEMDLRVRAQTEHIADKSRSLEILYDIATSLSSAHSLDELLEQFLDTLMILVDARAASVRLLENNQQTRLVASRGMGSQIKEEEKLVDINRCLCGRITQHGGLGIQKGIDACNQFLSCSIVEGNCLEMVVVPLQYRDKILGVYNLFLERPSKELGKDARDLLNSIGKHLGLAVEKARLDDNARMLAIMEERNMIGNELHDSLAQSLVSMRLQVKMLGEILYKKDIRSAQNEVSRLNTSISDAHTSLRELLTNFRTRMDERGLDYSIQEFLSRFRQETAINTYYHCDTKQEHIALSPAHEFQVFRIIQEALTNIKKHSNACNVRIFINKQEDGSYSVLIEDDGEGISDEPTDGQPGEHIGLSIMHERAAALNGTLDVESEIGEGTRVNLQVPAPASKPN